MFYGKTSVYQQKFNDPMGLFFTEEEFPSLKSSPDDVSTILQQAINRLVDEQCYGVLYIPEGTYPLKATVKISPSVRLIGYGKNRPVFVLPKNTKGFDGNNIPEAADLSPAFPMDTRVQTIFSGLSETETPLLILQRTLTPPHFTVQ